MFGYCKTCELNIKYFYLESVTCVRCGTTWCSRKCAEKDGFRTIKCSECPFGNRCDDCLGDTECNNCKEE